MDDKNDEYFDDAQAEGEIDIFSLLKKKKMYVIEKDFQKKDKGLKLDEFVKVMLEHLDYDKDNNQRRFEITLGLVDLFKEIDVNGDATMEWDEFSNHIIELGLLKKDRTFKNVIKQYYPSEQLVDHEKHETEIEKVYYFDTKIHNQKHIVVLEKDSSKFKAYNAFTCELLCEVSAHKGAIIAAELLYNQNLIATSSNDLTINFWDASTFNLKQIVSVPEIQLCMKYARWKSDDESKDLLYTGGSDAIIHVYNANTQKEIRILSGWNPFYKKDSQQQGHAGPIGDILPIYSQQTLVTAAMDGKICLWDYPTHQFKKELQGHDKGVYSLDWSESSPMNQCLISAGLDHEAFVWNTYVKERIYKLRGHNHPLIGVKCMPDSPQIITADISGMVKIWDVRNFLCMQTFNVPLDELNTFCLTHFKKKCIVAAGRQLMFYEYDEPKDHNLTDEKMCLKVLYNNVMMCFITLHSESIKVWSLKTGKLISVYRDLSQNELTCCILDTRQRKLFVGDAGGNIFTVNVKNGAIMKYFSPHPKMITDLSYWAGKDDVRRIISASRHSVLNIHEEDCAENKSIRYKMNQHTSSINSVCQKQNSELIASCSDDGSIIVTNINTIRQEILKSSEQNKLTHEIKKVLFLNPHDCLCASDSIGNVIFASVSNSTYKNKILMTKQYMTQSVTNNLEIFPVTSISFSANQDYLLLGDEFGTVTIWDCSKLLKKLKEYQNDDQKKNIQSRETQKNNDVNIMITQQQDGKSNYPNIRDEMNENIMEQEEQSFLKFNFSVKDIDFVHQMYQCHQDGITWIEIIPDLNLFATCSFDCCCYLWSFGQYDSEQQKQINWNMKGKLILGGDKDWQIKIDETKRKQEAEHETKLLLEKIDKKSYEEMFLSKQEDEEKTEEQNKKNLNKGRSIISQTSKIGDDTQDLTRKEKTINHALQLINRHKELKRLNENLNKKDKYLKTLCNEDYMGNRIYDGDQIMDDEDEMENDQNILNDLNDFKNNQTNTLINSRNAFKSKFNSKSSFKVKIK